MTQKLSILIVATSFLFCQKSQAQNISPFWSLAGNSNASNTSKLGTTNSIPLRLVTNNIERLRIDPSGKVGIGTAVPRGKLTIFNNGSVPAAPWASTNAIFTGFSEAAGTGDFYLLMASNTVTTRPNIIGRKARGTLATPLAVVNNDFITSFQASGYDGALFRNAANIDFFVDGNPTSGHVPIRISFSTGTNLANRVERVKIGSSGNITFNTNQLYLNNATGNIGVGTLNPTNKLQVKGTILAESFNEDETPATAILAVASNIGVRGQANPEDMFEGIGVEGISYGMNGIGVKGIGGGEVATGILGDGGGPQGGIGVWGRNGYYGVLGESQHSFSTGVRGSTTGEGAVGVMGLSVQYHGIYGKTDNSDYYAGYFDGSVYSSGVYQSSDRNLKQNITEIPTAIDIINELRPKSYEYRQDGNFRDMNLPRGKRYGLIAQDVEEVMPNLVKTTSFETRMPKAPSTKVPTEMENEKVRTPSGKINFKALNYTELIPIIIKGMQEQQRQIEDQQKEIDDLKELINKLRLNQKINTDAVSLFQNTPNPVKGTTRISFTIPPGTKYAQLLITDAIGRTIKSLPLSASGFVNFDSSNLGAGVYNYSIVIENKTIETKKMTVQR